MSKHFGSPSGVQIGAWFSNRMALTDAWVHRPPQSGISGNGREGADSVVVSGGYVDDEDHGEYLIYTGMGGNDRSTRRQIGDQDSAVSGNAGLILSHDRSLPVRVVRGPHPGSNYAPGSGYVYSGNYRVARHWAEVGRDGFQILRFRLEGIAGEYELNPRDSDSLPRRVADRLEARVAPPDRVLVGDLLRREPVQYSLRGDAFLWRELRAALAEVAAPADPIELRAVIVSSFATVLGEALAAESGPIYVPRFDPGHGVSAGQVDPQWWIGTAIPILMDRLQMVPR